MVLLKCGRAAKQLLYGGRGFDEAIYQDMLAALLPLTTSPPLNTVLIPTDRDKEITGLMFELFKELAKAGAVTGLNLSDEDIYSLHQAYSLR